MSDDLKDLLPLRKPTSDRPLLGSTVLVVEDSRFACEAMRLLCLRSGARIRRADCLASAARHLKTYRPTAIIVDMGLPDGSGLDLIGELAHAESRVPVILGTSGDPEMEPVAREAGADGFLTKPITGLAPFQQAILEHLPPTSRPQGLRQVSTEEINPDPIALRDDLAHVADILSGGSDDNTLDYVAQFLASLAYSATDDHLARAAESLSHARANGQPSAAAIAQISNLVDDRLTANGPI
ncbi:response regulator [Actibacterium sp. 188UL27-1]|uniref:response regulator n=1 Tax=Actibacterium sp. 188UL27-1 TaxID=2786961 RepID=UPI00195B8FFE|nr:response regulator [Actibacterium sp. 188UL27-1]MBM7068090.1 response regulator [Actibacterium sp. 188UL27-1]